MSKINDLNTELENYVEVAEAIKEKVEEVAENKDVNITRGTDTPLTVLTKINNATIPTPSDIRYITANGVFNVINYASANVSVKPNISGNSNTYFREVNGGSIVGYLFRIARDFYSQTTVIYGMNTTNKSGAALLSLMSSSTLTLSHTDSSVSPDYGTQYAYSPTVNSYSYNKNLGNVSDLITFVKSDGVTPFTTNDVNTSKNYSIVFSDATWTGNYMNMTNFNIKAKVTEL